MADQVFTIAVDDKAVATGLSRIDRQNKLVADRVEAAWARQGKSFEGKWGASLQFAAKSFKQFGVAAGAGFALAERALKAYADEFPGAAHGANALQGAMKDAFISLGRDLEESGVAQQLADMVGWLSKMREEAAGGLAGVFSAFHGEGESVGDLDAAQKQIEAQEARKKLLEETLDLQIAQAEAEGRLGDAADLRATKQAKADQEKISGLSKGLATNDPAVAAARESVRKSAAARKAKRESDLSIDISDQEAEAQADAAEAGGDPLTAKNIRESVRYRKQVRSFDALDAQGGNTKGLREAARVASDANRVRIASEEDSPAARALKADQEKQKGAAGQSAELEQAAELRRIEQLSLEGHEKEAALARVRLNFSKARADIESKDLVTTEEKARLAAELSDQEQAALAATAGQFVDKKGKSDVRTLDAGLAAAASHVFGTGGDKDIPAKAFTEQKRQTAVLERIERNTAKAGGGVFG